MKKGIIIVIVIILIGGGGFAIFRSSANNNKQPQISFTVVKRDVVEQISAAGVVTAKPMVELKSKASGEITFFPFEEGDKVTEKQLVIKLDPADEERNMKRQEAALASANARLHQANTELAMAEKEVETQLQSAAAEFESAKSSLDAVQHKTATVKALADKGLASEEEYKSAYAELKRSESQLQNAKGTLDLANKNKLRLEIKKADIKLQEAAVLTTEIAYEETLERMRDTQIFSPITGTIVEKNVEVGQIISSGLSSVSGGTVLAVIADLNAIFIEASVDESDIGKIKENMECQITADAFQRRKFNGKVDRIYPLGKADSNVTVFKVKIKLDAPERTPLLPGMTANVDIIINTTKDALVVPLDFVSESYKSEWTVTSQKGTPISVKVGQADSEYMAVLEGLSEGDVIIKAEKKSGESNSASRGGSKPGGGRR